MAHETIKINIVLRSEHNTVQYCTNIYFILKMQNEKQQRQKKKSIRTNEVMFTRYPRLLKE